MTREEARQVEQQLSERYPGGSVEVTRVPGGVHVAARDAGGWTFLHVADGSPLLTLLGAYPETEPGDLPGAQPGLAHRTLAESRRGAPRGDGGNAVMRPRWFPSRRQAPAGGWGLPT